MHNPTYKHGKLDTRATKMVFIRYPTQFKGYVMYGEHPNGGITKIKSRNIDLLEDELPSIGEIKKNLELYKLQQDLQPSLDEGEDLNSYQVTEDGEHVQRNEVRPHSPTLVENQPENTESPHAQDLTPQRDSGSVSYKIGSLHLLEKGGGISQLDKQIMKVPRSKGMNVK